MGNPASIGGAALNEGHLKQIQHLCAPSLTSSIPMGGRKGAQKPKLEKGTRIVWVRIPHVHPNQVRRYRRLYTKAVNLFLRAFRKEPGVTAKQMYHRLRQTPSLACLPAPMLDRAGREAATWHYWQQHRRHLTHTTMKAWWQWAQKNGVTLPEPQPGNPHLLSYPKSDAYLKGTPGGKQGQWPQLTQGAVRFYTDSMTGDLRVTIQRVIKQTPAIVGGAPAQLLQQALTKQRGLKVGCARLLVRRGVVYLAVPVSTPVALPALGDLHHPTMVGVDLGVNTLVAAVAITPDGLQQPARVVSGGVLKHRLGVLWGNRRRAHKNGANLEPIDTKIGQVIDYWVHLAARRVIEYAALFPHPVIVLEDLRSYLPYKWRTRWARPALRDQLSKWARGKVSQAIQEKAALQAIPVVRVDAAYSSHFCPRGCLCRLPSSSRTGGKRWFKVFCCPACGVNVPRDVNAAIELAKRGLRLHQRTVKGR